MNPFASSLDRSGRVGKIAVASLTVPRTNAPEDILRRCTIATRLAAILSALALAATPAAGQSAGSPRTIIGLGYAANAPELLAGAAVYIVLPMLGGVGLYADAKFDTSSREKEDGFEAGLTARQVDDELGDEYQDNDESWRSFNLALVRPVTPSLMLYGGAGVAQKAAFRQYYDLSRQRGLGGLYWVASPLEDETTVNVLAGMFLRLSRRFNAQFGLETAPRGFGVGMSILLP